MRREAASTKLKPRPPVPAEMFASRIKMEAVEMAKTPIIKTRAIDQFGIFGERFIFRFYILDLRSISRIDLGFAIQIFSSYRNSPAGV